ncbi:hypothetical protein HYT84_04795, partial [Candidatus Micrarchaeota archaeon]|nr:hypothetical protein [Candidatus Micrarchaeota archaeon]
VVVGILFGEAVKRLLTSLKFEKFLESHRVEDALGKVRLTGVIAQLVKYYVMLLFLQAAVDLLNLGSFSLFISWVLFYAPAFLGGIALFVGFALVGEFAKEKILEVGKDQYLTMGANGTKIFLMFLGTIAGLDTVGFNTVIIREAVITLIQAFSFGAALAFGIAFGLGGQQFAKDTIEEMHGHLRK